MSANYDVAIVGLGAMGSAAAFHLARRGRRVLALDRLAPPHPFGSSHGQTRIIREAYFEHPLYVPLVRRAYDLWAELERVSRRDLLRITGGLMIGPADGVLVSGARRSAEEHRLPHEILAPAEVRRRFPALRPSEAMVGVWEPRAGVLFPEACVAAHLELASAHGATLLLNEPVRGWTIDGEGVRVTSNREEYCAGRLLLTAGSWMRSLVPDLDPPLTIARQVLHWFEPVADGTSDPARCPIHLWETAPGRFLYGFPDFGHGVKLAIHHEGEIAADPERLRREVSAAEVADLRDRFRPFVSAADGRWLGSAVCMYTNTPDGHFLVDEHPSAPQVLIASPCSGHGFKFASAIGEILAELLCGGEPRFDLAPFRRARFRKRL